MNFSTAVRQNLKQKVWVWGWINPSLVPSLSPPPPLVLGESLGTRLNQSIDRNEGWILHNPNPLISVCVCMQCYFTLCHSTSQSINHISLRATHCIYRIHFSQYQAISCARATVFVCVSVRTCVIPSILAWQYTFSSLPQQFDQQNALSGWVTVCMVERYTRTKT